MATVAAAIPFAAAKPDEAEMAHQLSSGGPLLVIFDASSFQFYTSGVLVNDANCSTAAAKVDHVLSIEGLQTDAKTGTRYWIVRNSCQCPRTRAARIGHNARCAAAVSYAFVRSRGSL